MWRRSRARDSRLPTADIAGELGVDALVEGSLLRKGDSIEVTIQLVDGRSDAHLWAERYSREPRYVFSLMADMANAIGREIGITEASPGVEGSTHGRMGQIDPRAVDAYALGTTSLDRFTSDSIRSAIDNFEKAVAIEPGFALAWSGLAGAHAMEALVGFAWPRDAIEIARAAALKAIEADEQFYSGHSALGWADLWTWHSDSACESFEKALRLNPSAPDAIHGDADCLMFDGRTDASLARLRQLLTISPFSAMHNWPLPIHLYMERRFDRAIAAALVTREKEFYVDPFFIGETFAQAGMADEALYWLDKATGHGSYEMAYIAYWPHLDVLRGDPRFQNLVERVYGPRARAIGRAADSSHQQAPA